MAKIQFDPNRVLGDSIKNMSRQELCELVVKLCAAVRADVGAGGVRGGIFPDNISVDDSGNPAIGPARERDWEGQELQFAAPELYWNGRRGPASDVYSLGLLLYFGVNKGKLPFDGDSSDPQLRRMSGDPFTVPESAGRRLGEIIAKATQFKAADRPQSMEELGVLLDGCLKNLYLNGAPSAETIFNKSEDELDPIERMMVGIIERADAAPLAAPIEAEDAEQEPVREPVQESAEEPAEEPVEEPPQEPAEELEKELPIETSDGDSVKYAEELKVFDEVEKKPEPVKPPVVRLVEEKNPDLAPVVPTKPLRTPAVQYTKAMEREKKLAEEVKKRRRRLVAIILVMCAALVVIAIIFNALLRDLSNTPTPDNAIDYITANPQDIYGGEYGSGEEQTNNDDNGPLVDNRPGVTDATPEPTIEAGKTGYEIFVEDASWTEARDRCAAKGGRLAVVSSEAELEQITVLAQEKGVEMLWLGCHRVDGELVWESGETVDYYPWGAGEPSFEDSGDGVSEDYLLLWNHNGWVYNDSRNDPVADYPQWYGGNIGYVCEFDGQE